VTANYGSARDETVRAARGAPQRDLTDDADERRT
jgi:hypothetical protein